VVYAALQLGLELALRELDVGAGRCAGRMRSTARRRGPPWEMYSISTLHLVTPGPFTRHLSYSCATGRGRAAAAGGARSAGAMQGSIDGGSHPCRQPRPAGLSSHARRLLGDLPRSARWFWVLVVATGVLAGLGSVALLALLKGVQALAWPQADSFLGSVEAASPLRRALVPLLAGGAGVAGVAGGAQPARRPRHRRDHRGDLAAPGRLSFGRAITAG